MKKTADSTQSKKWVSISAIFMPRKRLGELLLEKGALTQPQLDACLVAQRQTHQRLGVLLVEKGYVTEDLLASALSEALGIPLVSLEQSADWSAVHMLRPRFCEQNDLFPWALDRSGEKKQLWVAMAEVKSRSVCSLTDDVRSLLVGSGCLCLTLVLLGLQQLHVEVDPLAPARGRLEGDRRDQPQRARAIRERTYRADPPLHLAV